MKIVWDGPACEGAELAKVEEELAALLVGGLSAPGDLIFHTVILTDDMDGPGVHVHGDPEQDPGAFYAKRTDRLEWTSAAEARPSALSMWTVYERPSDFRSGYVARRHEVFKGGTRPTADVETAADLRTLRTKLKNRGLALLFKRAPDDDPVIVETWI